MDRSKSPITASPSIRQATTLFLAKHKAVQDSLIISLTVENAALDAELEALIGEDPLLNVGLNHHAFEAATNKEAAKMLDKIMKDFDKEVGRAEDREEVEREMKKRLAGIGLNKSLAGPFKDAIARYEARDR